MSYQPVGQQTRPNKTTKPVPPKPTKIPKHDSAQKHHNPLKINRPLPQFYRYEMAVVIFYGFLANYKGSSQRDGNQ
jgi:hypothetical protein